MNAGIHTRFSPVMLSATKRSSVMLSAAKPSSVMLSAAKHLGRRLPLGGDSSSRRAGTQNDTLPVGHEVLRYAQNDTGRRPARAYTLVELTLSMAIMSLLMGGMASAMLLVNRAMPQANSPLNAGLQGYHAAEEITGDLLAAKTVTVLSPTVIEFTVADRDGDTIAETIRYEWSTTSGDPVTRKYNSAAARPLVENVKEFALTYAKELRSTTSPVTSQTTTPEAVLAYFDGWTGITPNIQDKPVNTTNWVSEYFVVVPPSGTVQVVFTRARAMMRRTAAVAATTYSAYIHRSLGGGSYYPASAALVSSLPVDSATLTTTFQWMPFTFSLAPITDMSRNDYCLVLKSGAGTTRIRAQNYQSTTAPNDATVETWTTNGGIGWNPTSNWNRQDLQFYVWGSFVVDSTQQVTTNRYFLRSVRLTLRVGPDVANRMDTDVQTLNAPEVTGL